MILAFDTYYFQDKAKTVCIAFNEWMNSQPAHVYSSILQGIGAYQPGEFYKRELPCILDLIKQIDLTKVKMILVDGFVQLDDNGKKGLGAHLYGQLECKLPVIGVAKTNFATINDLKRPVLRGDSMRPLFVTAIGIDVDIAAAGIKCMHGGNRIPSLLKLLDTLTKEIAS